MYQQPLLNPRRKVKELPFADQPLNRMKKLGATPLSTAEVIANVIQTPDALDLAIEMITHFQSLNGLRRATLLDLCRFKGISEKRAAQIKAALELGRRAYSIPDDERPSISSPSDVAQLVMSEMQDLEQEELWVISLNTRNKVVDIEKLYKGNVNTSVIRISEIMRAVMKTNAPAFIVVHCHPSGDPSPSPEDVSVTRQIKEAGKLMDIDLLDHVVVGNQRYTSLKERNLGFD